MNLMYNDFVLVGPMMIQKCVIQCYQNLIEYMMKKNYLFQEVMIVEHIKKN